MPAKFLTSLFEHKAWANQDMITALGAIPADADRMQRAVAVLTFEHASRVDQVFKARLIGEAPALDTVVGARPPALEDLRRTVAEIDAWYVDYARSATDAELDEVVTFTFISDGDPGRMTKGEILGHVITHAASHRSQVAELLGKLQTPVSSDMMTSFVSRHRREGA